MTLATQIKHQTQLRWNRVHKFSAKIKLNIEMGPYLIKTAESFSELVESFKLRHEVFNNEFCGETGSGLDYDRYDYYFDHLIIIHKESQKIIGTYRLNCSKFSSKSYAVCEFDLSLLRLNRGPHLELGRACIHSAYRKGAVISLLWRGIAEYMKISESTLLFGCSSLKIDNPREAALVYNHLCNQGHLTIDYFCRPTKKYQMEKLDVWHAYFKENFNEVHRTEAESLIPSLLKSYLKLGAKIACEPAFDKDFDCIDFLTILKKEDLSNSLAQKFKVI